MFIAALSTITKTWKQPKCSLTDEWKEKIQYMRYYSVRKTKQNKNNAICRNIYATRGYHTSKVKRKRETNTV